MFLLLKLLYFLLYIKFCHNVSSCSNYCDYSDYNAIINNLCFCCSYPNSNSFSNYTCEGCYSGYSLFQDLESSTPQKCVEIQQNNPNLYYPSNLFKASSGIYYECGQGCNSCVEIPSSSDYQCSETIDSSRLIIRHPTISNAFSKYTTYSCDAAYVNNNGVYTSYYYSGGQCEKCASNCFSCNQASLCTECSYSQIRFSSLTTFYSEITTDSLDCSALSSRSGTLDLTYYLRPQGTACSSTPCANTMSDYTTYYDSFYDIMTDLVDNQKIQEKIGVKVTIYIFRDEDGNRGQIYLTHSFSDDSESLLYGRMFERVLSVVVIQAAENCQKNFGHSDNTYCYTIADNERPQIFFKSAYIFFFVTTSFTFENLELHGGDLYKAFDNTIRTQYSSYCDTTLTGVIDASDCIPSENGWFYMDPIDPLSGTTPSYYENKVKKNLPGGLIVMQYIRDVTTPVVPRLIIRNCLIYNFYQHKNAFSFIYFEEAANILILTSEFYNIFFVNGLVSNTPPLNFEVVKTVTSNSYYRLRYNIDRGNPYTSKNKGLSCKSKFFGLSSVITTDCHLINITSSIFENFNPYQYRRVPLNVYTLTTTGSNENTIYNTYDMTESFDSKTATSDGSAVNYNIFQEAMLLGVTNVNGKIHLSNNQITEALSSVNHRLDLKHNCAPFQFTHGQNPDGYSLDIDISALSVNKLNLDKHMRQHLEAEERVISSLIYIRELHNEFVLYNNSFDSVIAETGSVLFIEDFTTSSSYPIMIISNKFSNNLAYAFGANLVLKKNSPDLTQTDCVGIVFSSNTFTNNVGCRNTYGNVIVSCEPNHPLACPTKTSVFTSLIYDLPGVNSQTNWANSFSEYYTFYNFKVNNLMAARTGGDAVLEKAFDDFIVNKTTKNTEYYDINNEFINPYNGAKFPYNVLVYNNNTCSTNYLLISNCIYIEGSMGILMEDNIFKENGVPLEDFFNFPLYKNSGFSTLTGNLIQTGFIENSMLTIMKEASPVVIRIGNYVHMSGCIFQNNFAVSTGDFYFGAAITMGKMIGRSNMKIENSFFDNHYGFSRFLIVKTASFYYDYCSFPLISINYWINWKDFSALNVYTLNRRIDLHTVEVKNSDFTANYFHLTPYKPNPVIISQNITKSNLFAKITYVKSSPAFNFVYSLTDNTKVTIQNIASSDSEYTDLLTNSNEPEKYSFFLHLFLDHDVDSFTTALAFNLKDTNLNPIFKGMLISFSECAFKNNYNYAGLAFLYTFSVNFSFIDNDYRWNTVIEAPTLFRLSETTTEIGHIVHKSGSSFSTNGAIVNITNCDLINNKGLLFVFSDDNLKFPIIIMESIYLELNKINKSSIIYMSSLKSASINNIIMFNCSQKNGAFYLSSITSSIFSNLNFSNSYSSESACFYAKNLQNINFTNISCYKMTVVSQYYLTIKIDVSLLSSTQPTASIILYNCVSTVFNSIYLAEMNLAHNGILIIGSFLSLINFSVWNSFSQTEWPNALYVTSDSTASITGGSFYNMTCFVCQGSLFIIKKKISISNCKFMNVTSNIGLLYSEDSIVNITNSWFVNNTAVKKDPTIQGKGGTLYIIDSKFMNNTCYGENILSFLSSNVYISDSNFSYNNASTKTKGIFFSECSLVSISKCIFTDYIQNNFNIIAGMIYSTESTITISNSIFQGCRAMYGAIFSKGDSTTLNIQTSQFLNNIATLDAPAIYVSCVLILSNCSFDNNLVLSTSNKAGHVMVESTYSFTMKGSNFSNFITIALYLTNIIFINIDSSNFVGNSSIPENKGIFFSECQNIVINNSKFESLVTQSYGAGVSISATSTYKISLNVMNTWFIKNYGLIGGGLAVILGDKNILISNFTNTSFLYNYAENDGAGFYYVSKNISSIFKLSSCHISGNDAILAGGGFRFMGMPVTFDNTSHIFNNTAYYGPNIAAFPLTMKQRVLNSPDEYTWFIILTDLNARLLQSTNDSSTENISKTIINETLSQINNYYLNTTNLLNQTLVKESLILNFLSQMDQTAASNPSFDLPLSIATKLHKKIVSGHSEVPPLIFDLLDYYGQVVRTHNSSSLTIDAIDTSNITKFNSGQSFDAINGSYILYPFDIHSTIGSSITLNLTTTGLTNLPGLTYPSNFSFQKTYLLSATIRECQRNEYLTDDKECWKCKVGTFNYGLSTCANCNSYTTNCLGGDYVGPQPGYWRLNGNSMNVLPCKTSSSCLGSNVSEVSSDYFCGEALWTDPKFCVNGWCGTGYKGVFCYDCVDGWAHSNDSCVPCTGNASYYVITVVIIIVVLIYIVFTIKKVLSAKKEEKKKSNKAAILMKILTNYFQLVSIVSSFNFNWSDNTETVLSGQSQASDTTGQIFNFDCVLKSLGTSNLGLRSFFLKLSFIVIFPILAYLICKLVWLLIYFKRHKRNLCHYLKEMSGRMTTSLVVIMFIIHPSIVKNSIYSFRCKNLSNTSEPIYYLEQDYEMQCWETTHLRWVFIMAVPSLIIWGFGIPMAGFFYIRRNLEKLYDYEFKKAFGFLYDGYRLDRYFWEFVILYRKIIMVFISVFLVTYSLSTQALAILAVSFLSYIIHIKSHPFEDDELNKLEKKALINSSFTIYCGLYYIAGGLPTSVDILLLILMILVNVNFIIEWIKAYLSEQYKQLKEGGTIDKIKQKFQKKKKDNKVLPMINNEASPPLEEDKKTDKVYSIKADSMTIGIEENNKLIEEKVTGKSGNISRSSITKKQEEESEHKEEL